MDRRRKMGALEDEVMAHLWSVDGPATPGEVHEAIGHGLAYTTVLTILTRLWAKGVLTRNRTGRSYAYWPVESEAERRAGDLRRVLDRAVDREAVLNAFVGSLSRRDERVLRRFLLEDD